MRRMPSNLIDMAIEFLIGFCVTICHLLTIGKVIGQKDRKDIHPLDMEQEVKDQDETLQTETQQEHIKEGEEQPQTEEKQQEQPDPEAEIKEAKDKYLRLYSEFENFRRRTAKEKIEIINTASKDLIIDLLPVLDDFDRALKSLEGKENVAAREGVELIANKFRKALDNRGLKEIEIAQGDDFNDEFHEAITQIPAPSTELEGKIVDVVEKGYALGDRVIRFAKVVTGASK